MLQPPKPFITVSLETSTDLPRTQTVIGRKSWLPDIEEFRGIPYGQVSKRWHHSTLRTSLPKDTFFATQNGPRCPQPRWPNNTATYQAHLDFPYDVEESEFDCLNLFIVRPSAAALSRIGHNVEKDKLPVYFFIHGGGFGFGSASDPMWDPNRLVGRGLESGKPFLAVFVNYRLHVFGFLGSRKIIKAQPGREARGCNFGLYDQKVALRWVKQNIFAFGGDPNRITIGGQSAGSIATHAHLLDAQSGGINPLFRRAIMQSGALGTLWPISLDEAGDTCEKLCAHLRGNDLEELSSTSTARLLEASEDLGLIIFPLISDGLTVMPGNQAGSWRIDLDQAREPRHATSRHRVPLTVLIGDTDVEASIWRYAITKISSLDQVKKIFSKHLGEARTANVLQAYGLEHKLPISDLYQQVMQFLTDSDFGRPAHNARKEFNDTAKAARMWPIETRSYRIEYGNPFPGLSYDEAQHGVDLIYLLDCFHHDLVKVDKNRPRSDRPSNMNLVRSIQDHWISFIVDDDLPELDADEATVFGKHRRKTTEIMSRSSKWIERGKRFDLLEKCNDGIMAVAQALKEL